MTEAEAYGLMGALVAATSGWGDSDEAVDMYAAEMQTWNDLAAAQMAVARLCRTWREAWRPSLGVVREHYMAEHTANVRAEQEALPAAPVTYPPYERGWEVAHDAYAVAYGRSQEDGPIIDPARAERAILAGGRWHRGRALSHFTEIDRAFGRDIASALASLQAIDPGRLTWANNGALTLTPRDPADA